MKLGNQLRRWGAPLRRAVGGMLAKALLEVASDDTDLQLVKVTAYGETHSEVERLQNYGFTSRPIKGAQALIAFIGGNRSVPVVIACDDGRVRIKLENGEVAMYNDQGAVVKLTASGKIELGDGTAMNPLTQGIITGECIDSFTGAPYADKSSKVFARKT